jgi:hypothetical protein
MRKILLASLAAGLFLFTGLAGAQSLLSTAADSLPDAPLPQATQTTPAQQPTSRPGYGKPVVVAAAGDPIFAPLATGPEDFHDRFREYMILTYGPRAVIFPVIPAGIRMANPPSGYPPEWRQGAAAFGRLYGDALAREAAANTARFGVAAAVREDFRYRPSVSTNGFIRLGHAIGYTIVDQSDDGHLRFAVSNFAGAAAGGFVGNLYLPPGYNDVTHAGQRATVRFTSYAINNVLREFVPDLYHLTQKLGIPFPHLPVPVWWTPWDADQP